MVHPMWAHQAKAVSIAETKPRMALLFEMGTGKTRTTIEILRRRYSENKRLMRTVVLGPKVILRNWKNEFGQFSKINQKDIVILEGSAKKRIKDFLKAVSDDEGVTMKKPKIIITNYEAMQMDDLFNLLLAWDPEAIVCDESHRCKNHQSKRAKRVAKLAKGTKHSYILTGTPILNNAMDIFNQYLILDGGQTFGDNFFTFRWRYFEDDNAAWAGSQGHFPKFSARPETYKELNAKIYSKAMRVVKSECLDLPPLLKETREVELSPEQARMYKEMRDEYLTYVEALEKHGEKPAVIAQLAITKALRLQQIITGFAKTENGAIHTIKSNPRLDALGDLLEELTPEHKVIVWATFQENYRSIGALCKKLGIAHEEIHGGIDDKAGAEKRFRTDPKIRVMVANQGAGGIGINLTEASYSIFFSRNFSLEHDLQAEARNYRGGSEMHAKVTRIDIVAPGTIDELIAEALASKHNIAHSILDWKDRI